jgi:hypothetical protein
MEEATGIINQSNEENILIRTEKNRKEWKIQKFREKKKQVIH